MILSNALDYIIFIYARYLRLRCFTLDRSLDPWLFHCDVSLVLLILRGRSNGNRTPARE